MSLETILAYTAKDAEDAYAVYRKMKGYPLCGHSENDDGMVFICVKGRGHDDGVHEQ